MNGNSSKNREKLILASNGPTVQVPDNNDVNEVELDKSDDVCEITEIKYPSQE